MDDKCNCMPAKPTYEELESRCEDLEEELSYKQSLINALEAALIREHVTSDHYKHCSKDFEKYWKTSNKKVHELYDILDEKGGLSNE